MPTCDKALAGIPSGQGMDAEGRVGDLVTAILDGNGVPAAHIGKVGYRVCAIPIVSDVGLLGLTLGVLEKQQRSRPACAYSLSCQVGCRWTHQDLDCEQAFTGIPGIDGELHRQTGRNASSIEARTTGSYLAGIVGWKHLDFEGA